MPLMPISAVPKSRIVIGTRIHVPRHYGNDGGRVYVVTGPNQNIPSDWIPMKTIEDSCCPDRVGRAVGLAYDSYNICDPQNNFFHLVEVPLCPKEASL